MILRERLILLTLRVFNHINILIGVCHLRIIIPPGEIFGWSFAHCVFQIFNAVG